MQTGARLPRVEALTPKPLSMIAQVALLLGVLALVAGVVWLTRRHVRRVDEADRELAARLAQLFTEVASRRALQVVAPGPEPSAGAAYVFVPPMLLGETDGWALKLDVRGTRGGDGDLTMQLGLRAPESAPPWPVLEATRGRAFVPSAGLSGEALAALDALSAASARVSVASHALIAEPRVTPSRDFDGRLRLLELDPTRLESFIDLGLAAARALRASR